MDDGSLVGAEKNGKRKKRVKIALA